MGGMFDTGGRIDTGGNELLKETRCDGNSGLGSGAGSAAAAVRVCVCVCVCDPGTVSEGRRGEDREVLNHDGLEKLGGSGRSWGCGNRKR